MADMAIHSPPLQLLPHRDDACPLNKTIFETNDVHGKHCKLSWVHFKDGETKGPQLIPMSPELQKVAATLERAAAAHPAAPDAIFCMDNGSPHTDVYFSKICSTSLSFVTGDGTVAKISPNTVRHKFSTSFRNFSHHSALPLAAADMEHAAAEMMLSSTLSWDLAYDDARASRSMHDVLAAWPQFLEFVKQEHMAHVSTKSWDPLSEEFASLTIE